MKRFPTRSFGRLLLTKRGVYLIRREGKIRVFELVPWTTMLVQLEGGL